jgi:adenosylcobinamide kinase/adenosylcobinamide-phosphate guanylyltransferase
VKDGFVCRSLLVLGGARSGKSAYAQAVAEASGLDLLYVATAQAFDAEMKARIAVHADARDSRWALIEEPLSLDRVLDAESAPGRLVLIDCATLWLSNQMAADHDVSAAGAELAGALAKARGPVVIVSNEVGQGIVPGTPLGRVFRDAQGRLNAQLAAAATHVVLVQAGLPWLLKPAPTPDFAFG